MGRATPEPSDLPGALAFPGSRALLEECGSRRPCAAEQWRLEGADTTRDGLLLGDSYRWGEERLPATWRRLDGTLATCLGSPFFHPPAANPGARRLLVEDDGQRRWVLQLTGENRCGLEGLISIQADGTGVDLGELRVEELPWSTGGRERARVRLTAREDKPLPSP